VTLADILGLLSNQYDINILVSNYKKIINYIHTCIYYINIKMRI
jgi:hypothetical protein